MESSYTSMAELNHIRRVLLGLYLVVAVVIGTCLLPRAWSQDAQPSGREMVDALHSAFGEHHARAVHTKGTIVTGSFVPSKEASKFTTAPHLQHSVGRLQVIARFSDFTGIPDIKDTDPSGSPKGFAVRFLLPDGEVTDIVNHSFNGFPTSNSADFATLLRAIGSANSSPPNTAPLDEFLATHPVAKSFLSGQKPPPSSWATTPYFGVNALKFTNARGESHYIRYRFVPLAGESWISPEDQKTLPPNYLSEELVRRLKRGPVRFKMLAQLAEEVDDFRDPSKPWPEDRKLVELGIFTFTDVVPGELASKNLQFEPGAVTVGIETADPMLDVRRKAYPVSVSERQ
ncbi:catalase family peroxidase [soil metagenome]